MVEDSDDDMSGQTSPLVLRGHPGHTTLTLKQRIAPPSLAARIRVAYPDWAAHTQTAPAYNTPNEGGPTPVQNSMPDNTAPQTQGCRRRRHQSSTSLATTNPFPIAAPQPTLPAHTRPLNLDSSDFRDFVSTTGISNPVEALQQYTALRDVHQAALNLNVNALGASSPDPSHTHQGGESRLSSSSCPPVGKKVKLSTPKVTSASKRLIFQYNSRRDIPPPNWQTPTALI